MSENVEIQENKKSKAIGYKLAVVVLAAVIIILLWLLNTSKQLVKECKSQKEEIRLVLSGELDSLMVEHKEVQNEYGELTKQLSEKDSIIEANAKEIKRLIAVSADYRRIKRKLAYLRSITQSYVDQIDSLFTVNAQLKEEVTTYKTHLRSEKAKSSSLEKEKEELTNIIETAASTIAAYNVQGLTYHLRGKTLKEVPTVKARRVDRVKICFTLGQNLVAKPGKRTVYVRISRPDKLIIAKGRGDAYSFEANGTKLQYSLKKEIDYQNKAMDICMQWDKRTNSPAMKGKYDITIWLDGVQIGSSSFTLE
jgi:myosin heavy subunit